MSELVITSKQELAEMIRSIISEEVKPNFYRLTEPEEKLNQKQAAEFLGITESTLIRWKYKGLVPVEQLPGSNKVTYYKSQLKAVIQRNPKLLQPTRK